jgi:hypothetical protein
MNRSLADAAHFFVYWRHTGTFLSQSVSDVQSVEGWRGKVAV